MTKKKTIGILGNGMVGSTLASWFTEALVFDVDPKRRKNSLEEINQAAEIVFIAVPTPYQGKFDLSYVEDAIKSLAPGKTIVIKSTVLPGTTEGLQKKHADQAFLFNPEFLTEKTALNDFLHPVMQLVGFTTKSKKLAPAVLKMLPKAKISKVMSSQQAEAVKYFRNCFYATKVIFANQFYDYCQANSLSYDAIKDIVRHDPMVGENHLEIFHQGGRGAGGKCLPKDLAALMDVSQLPLLKKVHQINQEYLSLSKKK